MYQSKDYYFRKAKQDGYPARSVYKLKQIDQRYSLIKSGYHILDLGCCPGSWLKYCAKLVGKPGLVVGVDKGELGETTPSNARFVQADINRLPIEEISAISSSFELVLSDVAPATTGIKLVDEQASLALAEQVINLAQKLLCPKGSLLIKIFQGEDFGQLLAEIKKRFNQTHTIHPQATRKGSCEVYVLGLGKREAKKH